MRSYIRLKLDATHNVVRVYAQILRVKQARYVVSYLVYDSDRLVARKYLALIARIRSKRVYIRQNSNAVIHPVEREFARVYIVDKLLLCVIGIDRILPVVEHIGAAPVHLAPGLCSGQPVHESVIVRVACLRSRDYIVKVYDSLEVGVRRRTLVYNDLELLAHLVAKPLSIVRKQRLCGIVGRRTAKRIKRIRLERVERVLISRGRTRYASRESRSRRLRKRRLFSERHIVVVYKLSRAARLRHDLLVKYDSRKQGGHPVIGIVSGDRFYLYRKVIAARARILRGRVCVCSVLRGRAAVYVVYVRPRAMPERVSQRS